MPGRHHQARALQLVRHVVDVRRPAHERVEARVLHEDLRRRRRVGRPFEIDVPRVDARIDEQRHDEVMAGRVLGQHHLLALAVLDPQIVDAANLAPGDHAVAARREVNLLAHHRHGARVLDQFRREQRDHVQRAPEDVALAAGEEVARLHRVVHDGQVHIEPVFLGKDALVIRLHAGVGHDDGRPAGPDVDRELDDQLAVLHLLLVVADAAHGGNAGALDQRGHIGARQQRDVRRHGFGLGDFLLHLGDVHRDVLRLALGRDLVPPAIHPEADHGQDDNGQNNLSTCCHTIISVRG